MVSFEFYFSINLCHRDKNRGRNRKNILKAPGGFHSRQTSPNHPHTDDDAAHPDMRAQACHDQVGRQIEDHVTHVEQRQTSRDLMRGHLQHRP